MANNPAENPSGASLIDAFEDQRRAIVERVASAPPEERPEDGHAVQAEFALGGNVPREEPRVGNYRSNDIYLRLENTVYGPISRDELHDLLSGGLLTGYESASSDLRHWTPLLYHPRMHITGQADPDHTHAVLREHTALPQVSPKPRRIDLEALPEQLEQLDEVVLPAVPLARVFKQTRKKRGETLDLPVFADLAVEKVEDVIARAKVASPGWTDPTPDEIDAFAGFLEKAHHTGDAADIESDEHATVDAPATFELETEAETPADAVPEESPVAATVAATPTPRRVPGRTVVLLLLATALLFGGLMLYFSFYR